VRGETFSLRRDHNGLRSVYNLGNERGDCPNACRFCNIGRSPQVSSADNIREFDRQHEVFLRHLNGPYHPLIYNQGNATNRAEFSEQTLTHVLSAFRRDPRVVFVSLNSRHCYASRELLESLLRLNLTFPIHFIFGVESLSPRASQIFGKDTRGELKRFIDVLKWFNQRTRRTVRAGYEFGLDLNLVFLPEMYLEDHATRLGNEARVATGMRLELAELLSRLDPLVPVEINLHPYYRVETLPYEDMDLEFFMANLPGLQAMVDEHNTANPSCRTHIFVGVEGSGYESEHHLSQIARWKDAIERFNTTGDCHWDTPATRHRGSSEITKH